MFQFEPGCCWAIYLPLKANFSHGENPTTIFEVKKGVAKVQMSGVIYYSIDEDGDLKMVLMCHYDLSRVSREFYIALNKKVEVYTLAII